MRRCGQYSRLSRAVMRNIRQNLFWAFGYNAVLIPVAAGVLVPFGGPQLSPMLGAAAMVDGMVTRIAAELGAQPVVVATGGLAPLVIPQSVLIEEHEPMLTLEGLRIVHERTSGAPARGRRR
jgi:hypothetical protein